MPRAFFDALSIPSATLGVALEADQAAWALAEASPTLVTSFVQRLLPGLYRHRALARPMSIASAIETILLVARSEGLPCALPVGRIKLIGIESDGHVWTANHRPKIQTEGTWIVFKGAHPAFACTRTR